MVMMAMMMIIRLSLRRWVPGKPQEFAVYIYICIYIAQVIQVDCIHHVYLLGFVVSEPELQIDLPYLSQFKVWNRGMQLNAVQILRSPNTDTGILEYSNIYINLRISCVYLKSYSGLRSMMQAVRSGVWTPIPAPKLTRLERTTTMTSMQSNNSYD